MYTYTCNAAGQWYPLNATTIASAKREATRLAREYGDQAGVIRVAHRIAGREQITIARKGGQYGNDWQTLV